jgi:hypothetical protein
VHKDGLHLPGGVHLTCETPVVISQLIDSHRVSQFTDSLVSRKRLFLILLLLIPIGLSTKFYQGPFEQWVHLYAGDIFYPMFWYFLVRFVWPRFPYVWCAVSVFGFCALVEVSQLWRPAFLQTLRRTFLGAVVLGSGFDWPDFVYYAIGIGLAVGIDLWSAQRDG